MSEAAHQFVRDVGAIVDNALAASARDLLAEVAARANGAPDALRPVQTDPVLAEFYSSTRSLRQAEIDYLIKQNNVPVTALCQDGDGDGWPLCAARVVFYNDGDRVDFADDNDDAAMTSIIAVLRDVGSYPLDFVAWSPRSNSTGSLFGRSSIVGEHEFGLPRLGEALQVHRTFLAWLRAGRNGIVIVDPKRAGYVLRDSIGDLAVEDAAHAREIAKLLTSTIDLARLVVPRIMTDRAA